MTTLIVAFAALRLGAGPSMLRRAIVAESTVTHATPA